MSIKDSLDLFIKHQDQINLSTTKTLDRLSEILRKLEPLALRINILEKENIVMKEDISEYKKDAGFVREAKMLFRGMLLLLIAGTFTAIWQVAKVDSSLTKNDITELIKVIKENGKVTLKKAGK